MVQGFQWGRGAHDSSRVSWHAPKSFLGVMNHAPSDIHFSVESDICSALNVLIQYLVESLSGVIHLVCTYEEGEGDQANAYKCVQGGEGVDP